MPARQCAQQVSLFSDAIDMIYCNKFLFFVNSMHFPVHFSENPCICLSNFPFKAVMMYRSVLLFKNIPDKHFHLKH